MQKQILLGHDADPSGTAARDEYDGIKKIGRLVLLCAGVLILSVILLVATAIQSARTIEHTDQMAERLRAANAIDIMTETGPLTPARVRELAAMAGLLDAHLSTGPSLNPNHQQIPLLAGQGPSGTMLTWTQASSADEMVRAFAPTRLPIVGAMLLLTLGILFRLRLMVGDIERQRRLAHRLSRSDVVTGLANRLASESALADLTARTAPFAVLVLDLDRFKQINDAFGHAAGDEVLRLVGARLSGLLAPGDLLARVGGDEFVLLSTSSTDEQSLARLARNCIACVETPIQVAGSAVRVGVSLGIVMTAAPHLAPASLVALADAALYRAKSQPGSHFRFAGDERPEPLVLARRVRA